MDRDRIAHELSADDIPWGITSVTCGETLDLLALTDAEVFLAARDLQIELQAVRMLLSETLTALSAANVQRDRFEVRVRALMRELQIAREDSRALTTQLRLLLEEAA
jgi:hypothetical protein